MAAANHFSSKLNNPLAESSVRNFVKYFSQNVSAALQEEIGKFAFHFGVDETIKTYKGKQVSRIIAEAFLQVFFSDVRTVG